MVIDELAEKAGRRKSQPEGFEEVVDENKKFATADDDVDKFTDKEMEEMRKLFGY